jgi:hypothetical protein
VERATGRERAPSEIRPAVAVSPRTALAVLRKAVAVSPVPVRAMASFTRLRRESRDAGWRAFDRLRWAFVGKGAAGPRAVEGDGARFGGASDEMLESLRDLPTAWLLWGAPGADGDVCSARGWGRRSGRARPVSRRPSIMAALDSDILCTSGRECSQAPQKLF